MKKEIISILANLRVSYKLEKKTPCAIVKSLYAVAEGDSPEAQFIASSLPKKRQDMIDLIPIICEAYHVGEERVTAKGSHTISFSVDMIFRFINEVYKKRQEDEHKAKKEAENKARHEAAEAKKAEAMKRAEEKKAEREAKKAEAEKAKADKAAEREALKAAKAKEKAEAKAKKEAEAKKAA